MPEKEAFLPMVKAEADAADPMSSWLNAFQIAVLIIIALATFGSTISAALNLWKPWQRAIVAGVPGLGAALLAILNPRVDWHRSKEIEMNAIYSAVQYEDLPVRTASERYWNTRRALESGWQKARSAVPPSPSSNENSNAPTSADSRIDERPSSSVEPTTSGNSLAAPSSSAAAN